MMTVIFCAHDCLFHSSRFVLYFFLFTFHTIHAVYGWLAGITATLTLIQNYFLFFFSVLLLLLLGHKRSVRSEHQSRRN